MQKKANSNMNDQGIYEIGFETADRMEVRPIPTGISVSNYSNQVKPYHWLHGFYSLPRRFQHAFSSQREPGDMQMIPGTVNHHQPLFVLTGCAADITTVQSSSKLEVKTSTFRNPLGALIRLDLALTRDGKSEGRWQVLFDSADTQYSSFLLTLVAQQEIHLLLAPVPIDTTSMTHPVYRLSRPIANQIVHALDKAWHHINRLEETAPLFDQVRLLKDQVDL